jgi:hypothetical protein
MRIGLLLTTAADDPEGQARIAALLQTLQPVHLFRLLRPRRDRPRRRAAERRDECAPLDMNCHATLLSRASCNGEEHITTVRAALRDFQPANGSSGSDSVIRRSRLNVRFARNRTLAGDL